MTVTSPPSVIDPRTVTNNVANGDPSLTLRVMFSKPILAAVGIEMVKVTTCNNYIMCINSSLSSSTMVTLALLMLKLTKRSVSVVGFDIDIVRVSLGSAILSFSTSYNLVTRRVVPVKITACN